MRSFMNKALRFVHLPLPAWRDYEAEVGTLLDVEPGEDVKMRATVCAVWLPTVLWADYHALVDRLAEGEWTIGRFLGFLVVRGAASLVTPIPMVLYCPACAAQHVDEPAPATGWTNPPHRTHLCQQCGATWRPANVYTTGVKALA